MRIRREENKRESLRWKQKGRGGGGGGGSGTHKNPPKRYRWCQQWCLFPWCEIMYSCALTISWAGGEWCKERAISLDSLLRFASHAHVHPHPPFHPSSIPSHSFSFPFLNLTQPFSGFIILSYYVLLLSWAISVMGISNALSSLCILSLLYIPPLSFIF